MRVLEYRFVDTIDEIVHIIAGAVSSETYEQQRNEIIDNYGSDLVKEAEDKFRVTYESLAKRYNF